MELPHSIPVYSDRVQRHNSAAEKPNSVKHKQIKYANKYRRTAKYHKKADELMLSTRNLPVDKFQPYKVSPEWTGPFKDLEYNPPHQNIIFNFSDFPELSNISTKFHTSLLEPFTPNNHVHFANRKLNQPGPVAEDRWEVQKVLELRSQLKPSEEQEKVQWKGWPSKNNQCLFTADIHVDLIQQFCLYDSKTATVKRRRTKISPPHRKSRQNTLDVIKKETTRAVVGIEEQESQLQQPMEEISSVFLQAYLECKSVRECLP